MEHARSGWTSWMELYGRMRILCVNLWSRKLLASLSLLRSVVRVNKKKNPNFRPLAGVIGVGHVLGEFP